MEKSTLENFIADGCSIYDIARELGYSYTNTRYWINKFGLKTKDSAARIDKRLQCECLHCGRHYKLDRSKGHGKTVCNSCRSNDRRFSIKKRCVAYKGGSCESCGYNKCLGALQFHHRDPNEKDFNVSRHIRTRWEIMKQELDKCMLMCATCHAEEHWKLHRENFARRGPLYIPESLKLFE